MEHLFETKLTASISTCGLDGKVWTSTTPYTIIGDKAYIYISQIAEHYYNLVENSQICIMIVRDESTSKNPFVLERATFKSEANKLEDISEEVWECFNNRFSGDMLEKLKSINFCMFEINLNTGRYVTGFGKAFDVSFEESGWKQEPVTDVKMRIK